MKALLLFFYGNAPLVCRDAIVCTAVVSCDTIAHESNTIDVFDCLAEAVGVLESAQPPAHVLGSAV